LAARDSQDTSSAGFARCGVNERQGISRRQNHLCPDGSSEGWGAIIAELMPVEFRTEPPPLTWHQIQGRETPHGIRKAAEFILQPFAKEFI
jgi:hypothetical protein